MERAALRDRPWAHHVTRARRGAGVPDRLRPARPPPRRDRVGRAASSGRTGAEDHGADFFVELTTALDELGLATPVWTMPVEIAGAIPFDRDEEHASYDAGQVERFWRLLVQADRVFEVFRSRFVGKVSPVHLFWGALDLAVTRFSGRPAPPHPGGAPNCGPHVMHEAYSHEVSSAGYWPGPDGEGVFYSYAYPQPDGFADVDLGVPGARWTGRSASSCCPTGGAHRSRSRCAAARLPPGELRRRRRSRRLGPGRPRAPLSDVARRSGHPPSRDRDEGDQIAVRDGE